MIAAMAADPTVQPVPAPETESGRRPTTIVLVYSWDMLLAIFAILGALAAFGGEVAVGNRTVSMGIPQEILAALSSAAYGGILIVLATLLTRRRRWVRIAQMGVLGIAVALGALSIALSAVQSGGSDVVQILVASLFLLIDAAAILSFTAPRIATWYSLPGRPSRWMIGTVAFWTVSSVALTVVNALS